MKKIKLILFFLIFSGCSTIINGITGKFDRFDSNEYYQITRIQASTLEPEYFCKSPATIQNNVFAIDKDLKILYLYSSGKPNNEPTVKQIIILRDSLNSLKRKLENGEISKNYCINKIKNLDDLLNILRKSSGEKKR